MIKDSKLIGTVIAPPFDWGEFKVGDLFSVINSSGAIITENGGYPIVKAQSSNNGLTGKTDYYDMDYGLTIGMRGSFNVYIQEQPVALGTNVSGLILRDEDFKLNKKVLLFLATEITTYNYKNSKGYENYPTQSRLSTKDKFVLPITPQGEPDYEWMTRYVQKLEQKHVQELETYLQVSGLSDTVLSDEELTVLNKFRGGGVPTTEFKVGDLFDISSSTHKFNAQDVKIYETQVANSFPYIVRTEQNNGIRGFIIESLEFVNDANVFTLGQDTGTIFYQNTSFFTGDKIKVLKLKYYQLNRLIGMYFQTAVRKTLDTFSWGQSKFSTETLNDIIIQLPAQNNGQPDYEFMEVFMRAQEKLSIQKLDTFRQKQIQATQSFL